MNEPERILIYKSDYENLIKNSRFLNCLQACGVDNWSGYEDAQTMMETQDDE